MYHTTQYQYDSFGRMTAVILPAVLNPETNQTVNPTTVYGYDTYGNLASITDAKGRVTSFTFDQFGHQLTRTLPMTQSESTTYDLYGREATHVDFKGHRRLKLIARRKRVCGAHAGSCADQVDQVSLAHCGAQLAPWPGSTDPLRWVGWCKPTPSLGRGRENGGQTLWIKATLLSQLQILTNAFQVLFHDE